MYRINVSNDPDVPYSFKRHVAILSLGICPQARCITERSPGLVNGYPSCDPPPSAARSRPNLHVDGSKRSVSRCLVLIIIQLRGRTLEMQLDWTIVGATFPRAATFNSIDTLK